MSGKSQRLGKVIAGQGAGEDCTVYTVHMYAVSTGFCFRSGSKLSLRVQSRASSRHSLAKEDGAETARSARSHHSHRSAVSQRSQKIDVDCETGPSILDKVTGDTAAEAEVAG